MALIALPPQSVPDHATVRVSLVSAVQEDAVENGPAQSLFTGTEARERFRGGVSRRIKLGDDSPRHITANKLSNDALALTVGSGGIKHRNTSGSSQPQHPI